MHLPFSHLLVGFVAGCWHARSCLAASFVVYPTRKNDAPWSAATRSAATRLSMSTTSGQGGGIAEFGQPRVETNAQSIGMNSASPDFGSSLARPKKRTQHKDVVIVGGGLAGLSAALYTTQMAPDRQVTILERETHQESARKTTVASFAAAGMLAPQSERLPRGPLLDLCLASRRLYTDFVDLVETLAQETDDEDSAQYLYKDPDGTGDLKPWSVGYMASGGFLAPAFAGDTVATWAPPEGAGVAKWLDSTQVREMEPNLHPDVIGGWWFPEDASVDARRLTCSLRAACVSAGVQFLNGPGYEVTALDLVDGTCKGLWAKNGKYIALKSCLVANGAWMRQLLPVPIEPHKGQSFSVRMPADRPPFLKRILFAQDSYIVPKADGRIVIGATVEAGSYDPNVTPAGLIHCMSHALQLLPGLADLPMEESWVGMRPTTPDKGPIIGKTPWDNLFLAGGYWRNGVLLAPKTGQLMASLLGGLDLSPEDNALLDAFSWDRFTVKGGGAELAAKSRYAASMHPIHRRTSGVGVSAAVGTELGSYSTATSAAAERQQDRSSLWNNGNDDAMERAAQMGIDDAAAFSSPEDEDRKLNNTPPVRAEKSDAGTSSNSNRSYVASLEGGVTTPFEGSPDAITVMGETEPHDELLSVYQKIQDTKASKGYTMSEETPDEKPDPGFRIYRVDSESGGERMVPPYTSQADFEQQIANERSSPGGEGRDAIIDDMSSINPPAGLVESILNASEKEISTNLTASGGDFLTSLYDKIQDNKDAHGYIMSEETPEVKPAPDFRIYRVDSETGEERMVPPYTTQQDFEQQIANEKLTKEWSPISSESAIKTDEFVSLGDNVIENAVPPPSRSNSEEEYNEQTFDGYTAIEDANSRDNREQELQVMREARRQNRIEE